MLLTRIGATSSGNEMQSMSEPHEMTVNDSERITRHGLIDRLFHWLTSICMLILLATALLPIFGIKFNWLTAHWVAGLILTAAVFLHAVRALTILRLRDMAIHPGEIIRSSRIELSNLTGKFLRPVMIGKYSVAQKLFHFGMSSVVLVAIATGLVMMIGIDTPFWERDPYVVSERVRGIIFVAHGIATLLSISMIIIHIYFAFRPEKLYFTRSMINGWIARADYEKNHDPALWREENM
jgi:formate dehydrogenase subunit gamma